MPKRIARYERRWRRWLGVFHTHEDPDGRWVYHCHVKLPFLHPRGVEAAHPGYWEDI